MERERDAPIKVLLFNSRVIVTPFSPCSAVRVLHGGIENHAEPQRIGKVLSRLFIHIYNDKS